MTDDNFPEIDIPNDELKYYVDKYLTSIQDKSDQTIKTYRKTLNFFIKYKGRKNFLFQIDDVKKYKSYLKNKKKMKPYSISTYMTALRRFCDFLIKEGKLKANPAKKVRTIIKNRVVKFDFLTKKQVNSLLNGINSDTELEKRDKALLSTMIYCACTEKEITQLMLDDFKKQGRKYYITFPARDNNRPETIEANKLVAESVSNYLKEREFSFSNEPIFQSYSNRSKNNNMTVRGVREVIIQRLSSLNTDDIKLTPNTLKHTAGIIYAKKHPNKKEIMERLQLKTEDTAQKFIESIDKFDKN